MFQKSFALLSLFAISAFSNANASGIEPLVKTVEEVIELQDKYQEQFFSVEGINSTGISLCSSLELPKPTEEKFCLSIGGLTQESLDSFLKVFPDQILEGTPIGLRVNGPIVIQPGVVVAD
jgi:hypothetical protein